MVRVKYGVCLVVVRNPFLNFNPEECWGSRGRRELRSYYEFKVVNSLNLIRVRT